MIESEPPEETEPINSKAERLMNLARVLVSDWPRLLPQLTQEEASYSVNTFRKQLRSRAFADFCQDYAEKKICGDDRISVDYYFGDTVVEIALDLRNSEGAFERGILKVVMAIGEGHPISRLLFLAKNGARARCRSSHRAAMIAWAGKEYGFEVEVSELGTAAEVIFDANPG